MFGYRRESGPVKRAAAAALTAVRGAWGSPGRLIQVALASSASVNKRVDAIYYYWEYGLT